MAPCQLDSYLPMERSAFGILRQDGRQHITLNPRVSGRRLAAAAAVGQGELPAERERLV
jgi:hypothetical protein